MVERINIIGDFFGTSGYAMHTRCLANALSSNDVVVETNKPLGWEREVNDAELRMLSKARTKKGWTVMISQPHYWDLVLSERPEHFAGFLVWEGDRLPAFWAKHLMDDRVERILVPSRHVFAAIQRSIICPKVWEKVRIVPHGVNVDLFVPQKKESDFFVFVMNKGWRGGWDDRGGVQFGIKAYLEEFSMADKVELRIHVNPAYLPVGWNFLDEVKKLGIVKRVDSPRIVFCKEVLRTKDLPSTYAGDVFLSPTMSDGFGLPALEALSCGLPVIQTGFGGQLDFVNEQNGWIVDYDLAGAPGVMYEGVKWAVPSVEHLRRVMREAYVDRKKVAVKASNALMTAKGWSWERSAEELLKAL